MTERTGGPARLVLAGGLTVDLVLTVDELPRAGDDVLARAAYAEVGGAFTVLATAVRYGMPAAYAGRYGSGPFGAAVATALAAEGVGALLPRDAGTDSGFRATVTEGGGSQLAVTNPGVEAQLTEQHLAGLRLRTGDTVYVAGRDLAHAGTGTAVATWLKGLPRGTRVVFAPGGWLDAIPWQAQERALRRCDVLTLPADAVRRLVGTTRPTAAWSALKEYAPRAGIAVVRSAEDGCWVATEDDAPFEVPAPPVDAPPGPTADDVHTGVLLASLAGGMTPDRAALRANVATALRATGRGAPPCPEPATVDRFLATRWSGE